MDKTTGVMTVERVQEEVKLLNLDNIRSYPCTETQRQDFYALWNRFSPTAARLIMIPPIFRGEVVAPTDYYDV